MGIDLRLKRSQLRLLFPDFRWYRVFISPVWREESMRMSRSPSRTWFITWEMCMTGLDMYVEK